MLKKLFKRRILIVAMAVLIFLSLSFFLYWKTFNSAVIDEQVDTEHDGTDKTTDSKVSESDSKQSTQTSSTNPQRVNPPDAKEVKEAINFLDGLQQETQAEKTDTIPKGIALKGNPSQDEMLELVREGISYYDSLVESARVNFSLEITSTDSPGITRASTGIWEGVFEFSGSQVRGSITRNATQYDAKQGDRQLSGTQEFTYNGETFEMLQQTDNGPLLTRRSDLLAYNKTHDPRFWGWNLSGDEPLTALIDRIEIENFQQVDWNGSQAYYIRGSVQDAIDVDLWLNPEKSYRPERFMYSLQSEGTSQVRVTKDFNFQEVAPDLWFPESAQSVTTVINTETGEAINIETATMTLTDVRVNEHIPPSRFSIDPPSGTTIHDMRSRETYTVGEDEE